MSVGERWWVFNIYFFVYFLEECVCFVGVEFFVGREFFVGGFFEGWNYFDFVLWGFLVDCVFFVVLVGEFGDVIVGKVFDERGNKFFGDVYEVVYIGVCLVEFN